MHDVVILCGGMHDEIQLPNKQKGSSILREINGKTILERQLNHILPIAPGKIFLAAGPNANTLINFCSLLLTKHPLGKNVRICVEEKPLGTGGALKNAISKSKNPNIVVINGNILFKEPLQNIIDSIHEAQASVLIAPVEDMAAYGKISVEADGTLISLKQNHHESGLGLINAGVYVFSKQAITMLPSDSKFSLEENLIPRLIETRTYLTRNDWIRIKNKEQAEIAERVFR